MEENGILAQVAGEYVSRATKTLPPAGAAEDRVYEVVIEAGNAGIVRMLAKRQQAKHHKHSHWFWLVYRAEPVEAESPTPEQ